MRIPHAKRYAARTAEQLHALRMMISRYVEHHWRQKHAKAIEQRRAAGDALVKANGPQVRLDSTMAQFNAIVDRNFAECYSPALPDNNHHGWR